VEVGDARDVGSTNGFGDPISNGGVVFGNGMMNEVPRGRLSTKIGERDRVDGEQKWREIRGGRDGVILRDWWLN
jgi:hypothetical protein